MKKNLILITVVVVIGVVGLGSIAINNLEVSMEEKRIEQEQHKVEEENTEMEESRINSTESEEQSKTEEVKPTNTVGEARRFIINNDNLKYGIKLVSSHIKEGNTLKTTHDITNNFYMKGTFINVELSHNVNGVRYTTDSKVNIKSGETQTFEVVLNDVDGNVESYSTAIIKIEEILD